MLPILFCCVLSLKLRWYAQTQEQCDEPIEEAEERLTELA